jgi:hypothetical protein
MDDARLAFAAFTEDWSNAMISFAIFVWSVLPKYPALRDVVGEADDLCLRVSRHLTAHVSYSLLYTYHSHDAAQILDF